MKLFCFLLLAALQSAWGAKGYEEVAVNCGNPKERAYYQRLLSEGKFSPPKNMWDECLENGSSYIFKCRVHPEFGIFCAGGKRAGDPLKEKRLKSAEIHISSAYQPPTYDFHKAPDREIKTKQEVVEPEKSWLEKIWENFKRMFTNE